MAQYGLITACYWAFTLTDGALRMLVVLFFHQLGYSPLQVAMLFLFYEFFGIVTNLFGGWVAARAGLAFTLLGGLLLQVVALGMLTVDTTTLTVAYVMFAQALSGIAKDLNKMSAKSGVKAVAQGEGRLYRLVTVLTGSKNALKGLGFFLGGALLHWVGFTESMWIMLVGLISVGGLTAFWLDYRLGKTTFKPKFTDLLSKSQPINRLSAARFFLFGARDVWFVVALPVFLQEQLGWSSVAVGTFLACWIIGYGAIQALAPTITQQQRGTPTGRTATVWGGLLTPLPIILAGMIILGVDAELTLVTGLLMFGALFAINSAVHSYLIVSYAEADGVTLDVGFYYMSNAAGRLIGTILSGLAYQLWGLEVCLFVSSAMLALATVLASYLPSSTMSQEGASRN